MLVDSDDIAKICVAPADPLRRILETLQSNPYGICLVVDENRRLLGTVTDGDCRRALLQANSLELLARDVMHREAIVVDESFSLDQIKNLMRRNGIEQVPIVNSSGQVIDVVVSSRILRPRTPDVVAVLLAGGRGTRLMPLTESIPKPMLPVGDKPMLERLINQLVEHGITRVFISISYLGHIIQEHFGDGSKFGCHIEYLSESKELGTAGPLRALRGRSNSTVLVVNGDLVTSVNFTAFVQHHHSKNLDLTIGVSQYEYQIPFGVVSTGSDGAVLALREKPSYAFTINAGFYAINPRLLELIPDQTFFPMNEFVDAVLGAGYSVGAFAVHESWYDVGHLDQYMQIKESP